MAGPITPEQRAMIIDILEAGSSYCDAAAMADVSADCVYRVARKAGIVGTCCLV